MTVTTKTTYTDTRPPKERNKISFRGRLMSVGQAEREGLLITLSTPYQAQTGGGHYVGYTLPEEGKLALSEVDLDMKITLYGQSISIRDAAEKGYIRILKENVTKYLPVGYEILDTGGIMEIERVEKGS